MMKVILPVLLGIALASCGNQEVVVLHDDFSGMDTGQISVDVGAHIEYHYLPEAAPKGNWEVSVFRSVDGFKTAWKIATENERKFLYQSYDTEKSKSARRFHPMLTRTGDVLWKDYTATVSFVPEAIHDEVGFAFRYVHDRNTYLLAVDQGKKARIKKVYNCQSLEACEDVIAEADYAYEAGQAITATLEVKGSTIKVQIGDGPLLQATDDTYPNGKIALFADVPARFTEVTVKMKRDDFDRYHSELQKLRDEELDLQERNPKPVVWKKISTHGFGVGRNLRFGDLNGDGETDILVTQVISHGPRNQYDEAGCLTALTLDGEILWRAGKPDPDNWVLTNDVGVQIHDLDNDGSNEVIYCSDFEIRVLNGQTGKLIRKIPTPVSPREDDKYERILGDALFFCDVSGKGFDGDLLIKDRYWNFWIYDNELRLKWKDSMKTGHYPYAYDADHDGKDELLIGYCMYDDNGQKLWDLGLTDHTDGVAMLKLKEDGEEVIFNAASDEGFMFVSKEGEILKKYNIGHVQNPAAANFRDDLPGLEVVTINFWGNQGIVSFFDSEMRMYKEFEPNQFGSMCLPINWTGKSEEFFVHNANVEIGGMYDGWGRRVVVFPDDGHPDMANAVLDLTGDCRDEVIVWDPEQIWIYTQDDSPKKGKLYKPARNPLYNYSNYQATVSLPGWNE